MSAPHIPNLNTLRRGGGRGRLRGRGGGSAGEDNFGIRSASKDRVVQGTDTDASVSRLSAVNLGYLEDPFARALTPSGSETRRLPIINRGTYVRTTAIDRLVTTFLDSPDQNERKKQIISLGAGSDSRVFQLLSSKRYPNLIYHEIDFPVNTTAKIKAIQSTPQMQGTLGSGPEDVRISAAGDALHSTTYHLHPLDLRSLCHDSDTDTSPREENKDDRVLREIDTRLPTLLISECCLVYLSPVEAAGVVNYFTRILFPTSSQESTPLGVVLYEPIRPDDAFGRTMVSNLAARGIQLQTLHRYASLQAQRERLLEHGFDSGQAAVDVEFLWQKWVSEAEKERVAGLEMLDEMEEWQLLARHYCVAWGWRDGGSPGAFESWRGIQVDA